MTKESDGAEKDRPVTQVVIRVSRPDNCVHARQSRCLYAAVPSLSLDALRPVTPPAFLLPSRAKETLLFCNNRIQSETSILPVRLGPAQSKCAFCHNLAI